MRSKTVFVSLSQFCERDDRPRKILQDAGFIIEENRTGRRIRKEEMWEALKDADAVLAAVELYDADLLAKLPRLKCISRCGAGMDAIDLEATKRYGIEVLTTKEETVEPVAQMTVAMILGLARNLSLHQKDFLERLWKKRTGWLLSEWTIGLIGFGQVGRKVEEYLRPFAPKIMISDPYIDSRDVPPGVLVCDRAALLQRADLVSIHAARDPKEGYLIKAEDFVQMKEGSFFVNTSRGYLVDERALQAALDSGRLAGAALDVFEEEPYRGLLANYPNVFLTPHVSTLTAASRAAMELRCAQNVVSFFERLEG